MIRVIEFLREAQGWRRAGLALIAGMAAALSMPPLDFWPLLFVAFPVVLFMLEGIERKLRLQSFFLGWCFGFGYFIVTLHWIGFAFFVDAEAYLWMMPFAVGGLAAAMAVYWGLACLCVTLSGRKGLPAALVFAVSLAAFEWLRGVLFTGFPWAAPGLASDGMGAVAQTASLWGMPALTLLIVLWAATWPFILDALTAIAPGHRLADYRNPALVLGVGKLPAAAWRCCKCGWCHASGLSSPIFRRISNGGMKMRGRSLTNCWRCRPARAGRNAAHPYHLAGNGGVLPD